LSRKAQCPRYVQKVDSLRFSADNAVAESTHAGLGITNAEFDIVVGHLSEALDKYKVPAAEHKEVMAIIETLRKDIVER